MGTSMSKMTINLITSRFAAKGRCDPRHLNNFFSRYSPLFVRGSLWPPCHWLWIPTPCTNDKKGRRILSKGVHSWKYVENNLISKESHLIRFRKMRAVWWIILHTVLLVQRFAMDRQSYGQLILLKWVSYRKPVLLIKSIMRKTTMIIFHKLSRNTLAMILAAAIETTAHPLWSDWSEEYRYQAS